MLTITCGRTNRGRRSPRLCLKVYRGRIEVSLLVHGYAQGHKA